MEKRAIVINENAVDESILNLLDELVQKGYAHSDGYLYYEDSDKEVISAIFAKPGKAFLE